VTVAGPGLLVVLSAPSGAGKTTLARGLLAREPEARFSVSATTRPPRGGERDGLDYHFVSGSRFDELVRQGALAEWAEVHGHRYGTPRRAVEEALARGQVAVFDIDVQGGEQIRAGWPGQTVTVLVLPPSLEELERRLRRRSTDDRDAIARRLEAARGEIARGGAGYDYVLVNDRLEEAEAALAAVVAFERAARAGRADPAAAAVAEGLRRGRLDLTPWLGASNGTARSGSPDRG
jgi:guanylate kinase